MPRASAWSVLFFPLLACGELIGIDEAHYDPSLEPESEKAADPRACDRYCDDIMAVCEGEQAQYPNHETCLSVCATLPFGSVGSEGNTLACRARQLELAAIEPPVHCVFAGPGGGGECGSNCEGLCSITMAICSAETSSAHYAGYDACLSDCQALPDLARYAAREEYSAGGHVQCRLYHVTTATEDAEHHCPHVLGGAPCINE